MINRLTLGMQITLFCFSVRQLDHSSLLYFYLDNYLKVHLTWRPDKEIHSSNAFIIIIDLKFPLSLLTLHQVCVAVSCCPLCRISPVPPGLVDVESNATSERSSRSAFPSAAFHSRPGCSRLCDWLSDLGYVWAAINPEDVCWENHSQQPVRRCRLGTVCVSAARTACH